MKAKKMSLETIQGKMSRTEMRSVNAGKNEIGCGVYNCSEVGAVCGTNQILNCKCYDKDKVETLLPYTALHSISLETNYYFQLSIS